MTQKQAAHLTTRPDALCHVVAARTCAASAAAAGALELAHALGTSSLPLVATPGEGARAL